MAGYFGTKASVTQVDGYTRDEADAQFLTPTGDASGLTGLPAGYTDADVDTHLNTGTAAAGQILSYTGSDYGWITSAADIEGVTAGSGLIGGGTSGTVTLSHADTSTQGSVDNSGNTVIQDITLDTYGHITGINSVTISAGGAGSAEAFVSFVGTGTLSVRGSGNVSSVSDLGTGNYRANFSSSLPSANFSATMGGGRLNSTSGTSGWQKTWGHATGSIRAMTHNGASTATDHELIEITATI